MLYPPILASTQSVVDVNAANIEISYKLSPVTSISDFNSIEVFVAQQSNGRSILSNGTLIISAGGVSEGTISINKKQLDSSRWLVGSLYKVQLRLRNETDNAVDVSEWSTALIFKVISVPSLQITVEDVVLEADKANKVYSLMPLCYGAFNIDAESKEAELEYQFKLLQGETVITESGWKTHDLMATDSWQCDMKLDAQGSYFVYYEIKTNNGYNASTTEGFVALDALIGDSLSRTMTLDVIENKVNARIDLLLTVTNPNVTQLIGNFVVGRASEKDNFIRYEDIKFLNFAQQPATAPFIIFSDYTVESGIYYKYIFQKISSDGRRTQPLETRAVSVDFEYCYLYRNGIQLKLSLNNSISSFKHTVLRNKQDTLGSKYPYITQNGNAYYAEFSLSGLISYQENCIDPMNNWGSGTYTGIIDEEHGTYNILIQDIQYPYSRYLDTSPTFFNIKADGMYYKDEKIIPSEKFEIRTGSTITPSFGSNVDLNPSNYRPFDHFSSYDPNEVIVNVNSGEYENIGSFPNIRETEDSILTPPSYNNFKQDGAKDFTISTELTDNNIFIERKFREKVEEFLNDFDYKLYKSPTEGNMVVSLMNITLKPIESLGRMLYEFSATAYEVLDTSLFELNKFNIINIDKSINVTELVEPTTSFGQIQVSFSDFKNKTLSLMKKIREQENKVVPSGTIEENYEYVLSSIDRLWIEPMNYSNVVDTYLKLNLTSGNFWLPLTKVSTLRDLKSLLVNSDNSLTLEQLKTPIIVNYICNNSIKEKTSNISRTGSTEIIYDFDQFIWNQSTDSLEGDLLIAIKNYLMNKLQIEAIGDFGHWQKTEGSKIYSYDFRYIKAIDIETQLGANIFVKANNADSGNTFTIGQYINSSRIFFTDSISATEGQLKFINNTAQQAIINFVYVINKYEIITE